MKELPFHLHSVTHCPPSWTTTDNDSSAFSLVGITTSWSVVLVGDNVKFPVYEGSAARGIRGDVPVAKRTIFQDIFGVSAFTANTTQPSQTSPIPASSSWKGKEIEKVFDAPAYLIPPLSALFDPLMEDFLTPRSSVNKAEEAMDHEPEVGDDEMDVDAEGDDGPIIVGNRLERIVDRGETDAMVQLFIKHAINTNNPAISIPNGTHTNGIHKPSAPTGQANGIAPTLPQSTPRINGSASKQQPKTKPKPTPASTPSVPSMVPSPSHTENSTPVRTGQKRKKSSGTA